MEKILKVITEKYISYLSSTSNVGESEINSSPASPTLTTSFFYL